MKLKEALKKAFTEHVPLKLLALALAVVVAIIIHSV